MKLSMKYLFSVSLLILSVGALFSYLYVETTQNIVHDMEREHAVLLNRMVETAKGEQVEGLRDVDRYHRQTLDNIADMRTMVLVFVAAMAGILISSIAMLSGYVLRMQLAPIKKNLQKGLDGDGKARVPLDGEELFRDLAVTINLVLSRLEQFRTELDRRQGAQAAYTQKMASLGEVAATVAHEMKNPLAGISGALQVLAEEYAEDNPRKEIANDILQEIERLDLAIKDLLFFARPPELCLIPADIHAIIDKARYVLEPSAAERGIRIYTGYGTLPDMQLDPDLMTKALLNIGANSVHAMGRGGTLKITTRYMPETGEAEVLFDDTRGIVDEETLKGIFSPSFSSRHLGSGFGLAISRNIIESHGGKILAEPVPGVGSRFRIVLVQKR